MVEGSQDDRVEAAVGFGGGVAELANDGRRTLPVDQLRKGMVETDVCLRYADELLETIGSPVHDAGRAGLVEVPAAETRRGEVAANPHDRFLNRVLVPGAGLVHEQPCDLTDQLICCCVAGR